MKKTLLSNIISSLESGSRPKGGVSTTSGDIPSLGAEHLNNQGGFNFINLKLIPQNFYKSLKKGRVKPNDILIVKDGATTGKVSFVNEHFPHTDAAINEHLFRVEIDKKKADPSFVFRFLNSGLGQHQILKDFRGATVGGISRGFIEKVDIPYPSIIKQKRIAAILDKADAILQKRQQAIQLADKFLRSVFLDMFGDPVINPKGWEMGFVGGNLSFLTSGSRGWAKYYSNRGRLFLRIQNVGSNRLLLDDVAFVTPPDSAESKRTMVKPGDVLISITADLGRTAVIPRKFQIAHINQHLALLRFNNVEPIYASAFLASKGGQHQIQKLNREGVKAGLNFDDIKSLKLLLPPKDLQRRWVEIYQRIQTQRSTYHDALIEADALFNSLIQRAFHGEL